MTLRAIAVTDDAGSVIEPEWLARAEPVHRQLRPQLPADYAGRLARVFANGAHLAVVADGEVVVCVAVWRLIENTYEGRRLYVDDLVSDETRRSQGAGKLMLDWLEGRARALGADVLALDSGVQRARAHRFYFREGLHISSFSLKKVLK
ncbi:GNAT family N-acetyltransferase [Propionivibrio soli]|uniref:GNAT family N-acetyltransferase n=1 Tax=Propionivibrio soli TaxID=2976531 RepID=UPI0021E76207|nr:GNAT family N-acetyltransferase [Propionivibrio soli]